MRVAWKREYDALAEKVAAGLDAWTRARARGENVDDVFRVYLLHECLDPAVDLLRRPRARR